MVIIVVEQVRGGAMDSGGEGETGWYNHTHPGCSEVLNLRRIFLLNLCKMMQIVQNQCVTHAISSEVFAQKA